MLNPARLPELIRESILYSALASAILLALVLVSRQVLGRLVIRHVTQPDARLKWLVAIRNGLILFFIGALIAIWAKEIRTFAISLVAIGAAIVVATKELVQCVGGYLLRATGQSYSIGDRIEVGSFRGEVIDHNILTTTILEIGPGRAFHMHTGRRVVFPNSLLFSTPVINESSTERYVVHVFSIPLSADQDWQRAEQILLEAARTECTAFLDEARRYMEQLEQTHAISGPSVEPRVAVQIPEPNRLHLLVRIPVPVGRQGRIEQNILRRFLADFYSAPRSLQ